MGSQQHLQTLLWSQVLVVALFFSYTVIYLPGSEHRKLLALTTLLCIGGVSIFSHFFRRTDSAGIGAIVSLATFMLFSLLPSYLAPVFWIFAAYCFARELKNLVHLIINNTLVFLLSALTLLAIFLPYFGLDYSQPFNEIRLTAASVHVDSLYHASIASMIKMYNSVSHGLHGLGQLEYHFGSHLLMAGASSLSGLSSFQSYSYFFVFMCPMLLAVMIVITAEQFLPSKNRFEFCEKLFTLAFCLLATGALVQGSILHQFGAVNSYFESESYTVSLIFLLATMTIVTKAYRQTTLPPYLILGIIAGLALATISKISTGFCTLALLGSWALLSGKKFFSKEWLFRCAIFFAASVVFLGLFLIKKISMGTPSVTFVITISMAITLLTNWIALKEMAVNGKCWMPTPMRMVMVSDLVKK